MAVLAEKLNSKCFLIIAALAIFAPTAIARSQEVNANCSEKARQLVDQAWDTQPMNAGPANTANPAKAELLYKQALEDSPKCLRALRLVTSLLLRDKKYALANKYNTFLLQQYPADEVGLMTKADILAHSAHDYPGAIDILTKLFAQKGPGNGALYYELAGYHSLANNIGESLRYLKLAMSISKNWGNSGNAQRADDFKNLRKDPRFWALVK